MTKPGSNWYLTATYKDLLDRLDSPKADSDIPVLQTVLALRASLGVEKHTRNLVIATWALVLATVVLAALTAKLAFYS